MCDTIQLVPIHFWRKGHGRTETEMLSFGWNSITGCNASYQNDNFQCSQWWKFSSKGRYFHFSASGAGAGHHSGRRMCLLSSRSPVPNCMVPTHEANKQRVLMHGHQGWNVRHGLCHIYVIDVYIWVVYSFCLFCCLFIIVTTQFVALYKPCKPKPKPSTYHHPPPTPPPPPPPHPHPPHPPTPPPPPPPPPPPGQLPPGRDPNSDT